MSSYKLAMMGDSLSGEIFRALGIETFDVHDQEKQLDEMRRTLSHWIRSEEYGAVFITETLMEPLDEIIDSATYFYLPSIILIPEIRGSKGLAESIVRETLKKAAGRDIMAEND